MDMLEIENLNYYTGAHYETKGSDFVDSFRV